VLVGHHWHPDDPLAAAIHEALWLAAGRDGTLKTLDHRQLQATSELAADVARKFLEI
jgi:hypothetical protein